MFLIARVAEFFLPGKRARHCFASSNQVFGSHHPGVDRSQDGGICNSRTDVTVRSLTKSLLSASGIVPQKRKRIPPGGRIGLELNARERDLILNHTFADDDRANRFRVVRREDEQPVYGFTLDDLDELAGYVAAEANHAKD